MKQTQIWLNRSQLLFLALLVESMLLFLLAPTGHSYWFSWLCMVQFLVSTVVYIVVQKKKNYFDFDLVFLLTFFFIMFFFPVFMYGTDLENLFFAFQYEYNHDVISRATALSLLGAQAYMFGGLMVNKPKIKNQVIRSQTEANVFYKRSIYMELLKFVEFGRAKMMAGELWFSKLICAGLRMPLVWLMLDSSVYRRIKKL